MDDLTPQFRLPTTRPPDDLFAEPPTLSSGFPALRGAERHELPRNSDGRMEELESRIASLEARLAAATATANLTLNCAEDPPTITGTIDVVI